MSDAWNIDLNHGRVKKDGQVVRFEKENQFTGVKRVAAFNGADFFRLYRKVKIKKFQKNLKLIFRSPCHNKLRTLIAKVLVE